MLDWLIIGGGVHGTHLSLYLTRRKGIPTDRLRVLDPSPEPLTLWAHHARNTGMEFLRSSHAHNLHYDPFSLVTFARTRHGQPLARFIDPYGRPALDLFMAHCQQLISRYNLNTLRLLGRAETLTRLSHGWRVETGEGSIEAQRVVIAIGNTEQPYWPDWALTLRESGAPIHHIFDPGFNRASLPPWTQAVVIGGGITAAQTALTMAAQGHGTVTLLMRHAIRIQDFDADPLWVAVNRPDFRREPDVARRRAIITTARNRGSMPPDVARDLQAAVDKGLLSILSANVDEAGITATNQIALSVSHQQIQDSAKLITDCLILATGFSSARPGGAWLDRAIFDHRLPLAPDGYPLTDESLRWADGLYVSGPLAELEIGPVARNIIGARLASECIGRGI